MKLSRIFTTVTGLLFFVSSPCQSVYDTLTVQEKIYGLSNFWKEASYNFVFFDKTGINWDSAYQAYIPKVLGTKNLYEYQKVLNDFIRLLQDGHTSLTTDDYHWKDMGGVPIVTTLIDKRRFVKRIDKRLIREIPPGTEILTVNGLPQDSFYKSNSFPPLKNTAFHYCFKSKGGKVFRKTLYSTYGKDTSVNYLPEPPAWVRFDSRPLPGGIQYVKINTFGDEKIPLLFDSIVPAIKTAKALIIDIRENGGGNSAYARSVAAHLVDKNYIIESAWKTRVHKAANKAWGSLTLYGMKDDYILENQDYFKGNVWEFHPGDTFHIPPSVEKIKIPIVVLVSRATYSAAEDFLIMLDESKNITLIGQYSGGSSGQPLIVPILPGKVRGRICAKRDTYPDGREYIGIGIRPDILVEKSVEDYMANKDTELEAALAFLKTKVK